MLKTVKNPGSLPLSVFDEIRAGVAKDRSQFSKIWLFRSTATTNRERKSPKEFGNPSGCKECNPRSSVRMTASRPSPRRITEDLKTIEVPTLVIQGDADQIVPIDDSGRLSSKLVKNGTLKVIAGAPHGLCTAHPDVINEELLAFVRKQSIAA